MDASTVCSVPTVLTLGRVTAHPTHTSAMCRDSSVMSMPATCSCVGSDTSTDIAQEELPAPAALTAWALHPQLDRLLPQSR